MRLRPLFWGSTTSLVLGILMILSVGLDQDGSGANGVAGAVLVIGSLIYRSAKQTVLGVSKPVVVRRALEVIGVLAIVAIVGLQRDLAFLIREDPVPNLVIPLWALIAFSCAVLGRPAATSIATAEATTTPEESEALIGKYRAQYEAKQRTREKFAVLGKLAMFAAVSLVLLYSLIRFVKWAWTG